MSRVRDLINDFENSYTIASPISIAGSKKPTDIRQVCETVADFDEFFAATGMDLRFEGLVTYEKNNNRFLGYKTLEDGSLGWVELEGLGSEAAQVENRIKHLEDKINSMYLEYEEQLLLFK